MGYIIHSCSYWIYRDYPTNDNMNNFGILSCKFNRYIVDRYSSINEIIDDILRYLDHFIFEYDSTCYEIENICKRGKLLYENNFVSLHNCKYGTICIEYNGHDYDYETDICFAMKCIGSENNIYDIELHFILEDGTVLYKCSCPYFNKNNKRKVCKHVIASLYWIRKNYIFDFEMFTKYKKNNSELKGFISNNEVALYDSKIVKDVIFSYNFFVEQIGKENINRIVIYEQICRYLENNENTNNYWSDKKLRLDFNELNIDFDSFVYSCIIKFESKIEHKKKYKKEYKNGITLIDRIDNLKAGIIDNVETISFSIFQKIFEKYIRITKFNYKGNIFSSKYIFVPLYFEIIIFKAKDVPYEFYQNFKLGKIGFNESYCYKFNNEKYLLIINKDIKYKY